MENVKLLYEYQDYEEYEVDVGGDKIHVQVPFQTDASTGDTLIQWKRIETSRIGFYPVSNLILESEDRPTVALVVANHVI